MIRFQTPELFLLLCFIPWIYLRLRAHRTNRMQLRGVRYSAPLGVQEIESLFRSARLRVRDPVLIGLLLTAYILCVIAIARPQRETTYQEQQWSGRDLLLALDISGSMRALDFTVEGERVDRLTALKHVMGQFIDSRKGDRIGIVVFGDQVFTQCPLTLDHRTLLRFLNELAVGMAGQGTAIGDALGTSLKRLKPIEAKSKAIILVTDGKNNSGNVAPLEMAKLARELGTKIYVVGIGGTEPAPLPVQNALGLTTIIQRPMEYDEETLRSIAQLSEGHYFNAKNLEGLEDVYRQIDRLEVREDTRNAQIDREELYQPFALGALFAMILFVGLRATVFLKVTR